MKPLRCHFSVTCPLQAGAADAGSCGFQQGVLETETDQIFAETQRHCQRSSLLFHTVEQDLAKDWR